MSSLLVSLVIWILKLQVVHSQECSVCSGGVATIPDDKLDVVVSGGTTCADFADFAASFEEGTDICDNNQRVTSIYCGCPVDQSAMEGKCSLCAAGTILTDDQLGIVVSQDDGYDVTCKTLISTSQAIDEDTEDCEFLQLVGEISCGCETTEVSEGLCTLCFDGSVPSDEFLDVIIPVSGDNITCSQALQIAIFTEDPYDCAGVQFFGATFCGCPPLPVDENSCTLCSDGTPPPEGTKYLGNDDGYDLTCEFINNILVSSGVAGSPLCDATQAIVGPLCGCPTPEDVSNICRVCGPPGTLLPEPSRTVKLPSVGSPIRQPCFSKEVDLASEIAFEEGCDGPYKEAAAAACCGCSDWDTGPTVQMVKKAKKKERQTCSWLSEQDSGTIDLYCSALSRVRRGCRAVCDTCQTNRPCEDKDDSFLFNSLSSKMRSCEWLSRKKKEKAKSDICKLSPGAREFCPLSCGSCP